MNDIRKQVYHCNFRVIVMKLRNFRHGEEENKLARLRSSVQNAKSAVQRIAIFKQALDLASTFILLAGAVYSGNAAGIPAATLSLEDAAEAIVNSEGSGA